ncbi:MAG: nitronate monooxygenase [Tissierellia bacterium]|nr:nitronate monooxygenase [Tissierellia bacterium]
MFTIQELLKIDYPIIQGGMAHVSDYHLASAVSNAGGLGVLYTGGIDAPGLRDNLRKMKEATKKPFALNLALPYPNIDELFQVALEEGIDLAIVGGGNPAPYFDRLLSAGVQVIPVVGNPRMAQKAEKLGALACIFEGAEAGGHIGQLNTMAVLPSVVDAVDIPVIAAGGIASGRQILAAEALGAAGVQLGTAFLLAEETQVHPNYKKALIDADFKDSVVTGITGHPVRCLRNQMTDAYLKIELACGSQEDLEDLGKGASRRATQEGDVQWGSLFAGQVAGALKEIKPAKVLIEDLLSDYEAAKKDLLG